MVRQASLGDMGLDSDLQNIIHRDSCAVLQKDAPLKSIRLLYNACGSSIRTAAFFRVGDEPGDCDFHSGSRLLQDGLQCLIQRIFSSSLS